MMKYLVYLQKKQNSYSFEYLGKGDDYNQLALICANFLNKRGTDLENIHLINFCYTELKTGGLAVSDGWIFSVGIGYLKKNMPEVLRQI